MSLHPTSPARRRVGRLAGLLALVSALVAVPATDAAGRRGARGAGVRSSGSTTRACTRTARSAGRRSPSGSVRMWDNHVSWRELETAPGVFDWTLIDAEMAKARAHGASRAAGPRPDPDVPLDQADGAASTYGPGASAMPTKAAWIRYVREVAVRNRTVWGGVATFQVWNEANVRGYWSGHREADGGTDRLDRRDPALGRPGGPPGRAGAGRPGCRSQQRWIDTFYAQKVAGKNVSRVRRRALVPALPGDERHAGVVDGRCWQRCAGSWRRHHISKPIWNTEVNYGLVGGGQSVAPLAVDRQVANVLRTFVLNAGNRVARVYWYSWDLLGHGEHPDGPGRPDHAHARRAGVRHGAVLAARVRGRPAARRPSRPAPGPARSPPRARPAGSCGTRAAPRR